MYLTHSRIDAAAALQAPQPPPRKGHRNFPVQEVVQRQPGEKWRVTYDPIVPGGGTPPVWAVETGEQFMLPLVPYLTHAEPDLAMAFMFQLGAEAVRDFTWPVVRLHLATGVPVEQTQDTQTGQSLLRYWLGIAILL